MPTTTRGAFPYPAAGDNWKQVRTAIQNLAQQTADVTALYVESVAASRPAVGVAGRFHRATDTGALSLDTGSAWIDLPSKTVTDATYEPLTLIAQTILGSDGNVVLSSIPATYKHLRLVVLARSNRAAVADGLLVQLNTDTSINYDWQKLEVFGTTVTSTEGIAATSMSVGGLPAASAPASVAGPLILDIPDYARTTWHKAVRSYGGYKTSAATGGVVLTQTVGFWRSTAAVSSVSLLAGTGVLAAGSIISLYGSK